MGELPADNSAPEQTKLRTALEKRRAEQAARRQADEAQRASSAAVLAAMQDDKGEVVGLEDATDCSLDDEERKRRYYAKAVAGLIEEMQATRAGSRNHTLNTLAFRLGRLSAGLGQPVEEKAIELGAAAMAAGLDRNEVIRTLNSGVNKGLQHPIEWGHA